MKIKRNKIFAVLIFLVALAIILIGQYTYAHQKCTYIDIYLPQKNLKLISENQIREYIYQHISQNIINQKFKNINLEKIQNGLLNNPFIQKAIVERKPNGYIHITVYQRFPIAKLFINNKPACFIDSNGYLMPYKNIPIWTVIINGNIPNKLPKHITSSTNILKYYDSTSTVFKAFTVANYLNSSKLWKKFFPQIYIDNNNNILLEPIIGKFVVLINSTSKIEKKFRNLHYFLKSMNKIGWNNYSIINISYPNQIICKKIPK